MVYRDTVVMLVIVVTFNEFIAKKTEPNFEKETENIVKKENKIFTHFPIFKCPCLPFYLIADEIPRNSTILKNLRNKHIKFPFQNEYDFTAVLSVFTT